MKKILSAVFVLMIFTGMAFAEKITIDVCSVSPEGMGGKIGMVKAEDSDKGLVLKVDVKGIPEGEHGFHVHEHASGEPALDGEGKMTAALAAGGHYDPDNTGKHLGPYGQGHKGDLPFLTADKNGNIKETVTAPRMTVKDLKGRSLMIHAGGDNYSDEPAILGGGGARIAVGLIK